MQTCCDPSVATLLIYLYGFMALCSIVAVLHPRLRGPAGKPVRQAIHGWWPPALTAGIAVIGGNWAGILVCAVVSVWGLYEYLRMASTDARNIKAELFAYAVVPAHYGLIAVGAAPFGAGLAMITFGILPLSWMLTSGSKGMLSALPRLQWGIVLIVAGISYIARLLSLDAERPPAGGAGLASLLLMCVWSSDAAQYVSGKLVGRSKLAPALSPNKTWEGLAGGVLIAAVVGAAAAPLVTPFSRIEGAFIGVALSVAGVLGDLLVSAMKREAGVKDTGAVIAQHGGVLDRCDSLLVAAPVYFYGIQLWLP